jgi:hypothetical protein
MRRGQKWSPNFKKRPQSDVIEVTFVKKFTLRQRSTEVTKHLKRGLSKAIREVTVLKEFTLKSKVKRSHPT